MIVPSLIRRPWFIYYVLRFPNIFRLGWLEAHSSFGRTYDDNPWSAKSSAYDIGRDLRRWGRA